MQPKLLETGSSARLATPGPSARPHHQPSTAAPATRRPRSAPGSRAQPPAAGLAAWDFLRQHAPGWGWGCEAPSKRTRVTARATATSHHAPAAGHTEHPASASRPAWRHPAGLQPPGPTWVAQMGATSSQPYLPPSLPRPHFPTSRTSAAERGLPVAYQGSAFDGPLPSAMERRLMRPLTRTTPLASPTTQRLPLQPKLTFGQGIAHAGHAQAHGQAQGGGNGPQGQEHSQQQQQQQPHSAEGGHHEAAGAAGAYPNTAACGVGASPGPGDAATGAATAVSPDLPRGGTGEAGTEAGNAGGREAGDSGHSGGGGVDRVPVSGERGTSPATGTATGAGLPGPDSSAHDRARALTRRLRSAGTWRELRALLLPTATDPAPAAPAANPTSVLQPPPSAAAGTPVGQQQQEAGKYPPGQEGSSWRSSGVGKSIATVPAGEQQQTNVPYTSGVPRPDGVVLDGIHLLTAARRLRDVAPWVGGGDGEAVSGGGGDRAAWGRGGGAVAGSVERQRQRHLGLGPGHQAPGMGGRSGARERALFRSFVAEFTELCRPHLPFLAPPALAGLLYTLAVLRCPPAPEWMLDWLRAAGARLPYFGPQELSNALYGLGMLEYDPGDPWLDRYCRVVLLYIPQPADAAEPAASAEDEEDDLGVAQQVQVSSGPSFTPHGLSQVLWGFARLGYLPAHPHAMAALCGEVRRQLPGFTSEGLANTLWALATLGHVPPDPWVARAAATCLRLMPVASSYDLSVYLWALLRLGHAPGRGWLAGYLAAAYRRLPAATPEHAARMLWGLAKMQLQPPDDWLRRWLDCSLVRLLEAPPTTLATMAWALATLGVRPPRRFSDTLLLAAWEAPLRAFSPRDLGTLVWALAAGRTLPEEAWMDELWSVSYKRMRAFAPRRLALLLWSCVTLGQAPCATWLAGFEAVTLPAMRHMSPEGCALAAYAYGMLEQAPSHEWMTSFYECAAADDFEGFTALGLERVIWGLAKMGLPQDSRPADPWVAAFLEATVRQMDEMSYGNVANLMYGLAVLGVRPGAEWLRCAMGRVGELLDDFGHTTASKMVWALPRLAAGAGGGVGQAELAGWQRVLEARLREVCSRPRQEVERVALGSDGEEDGEEEEGDA